MESFSRYPTFYLNENVAVSLVPLLAEKGIPAISTRDVGNLQFSDEEQLVYASKYGYVLITHNRRDFIQLHKRWMAEGKNHAGIVVLEPSERRMLAQRIYKFVSSVYPTVRAPFCLSPPEVDNSELPEI